MKAIDTQRIEINIKPIINGFIVTIERYESILGEDDRDIYFATYKEALEHAAKWLNREIVKRGK